jgi:hypothetical protein
MLRLQDKDYPRNDCRLDFGGESLKIENISYDLFKEYKYSLHNGIDNFDNK